jgi:hypothetical protein
VREGPSNGCDNGSVNEQADDNAYHRISESGLFDLEYYRNTYDIPIGVDPLRHFLDVGLTAGHLPSAEFDPGVYQLVTGYDGSINPLLHYLNKGRPKMPSLDDVSARIVARFSRDIGLGNRNAILNPRAVAQQVAYLDRLTQERVQTAEIDGATYRVEVPPPEFFLDRLRRDECFAFARLTHGFWDGVSVRNAVAADPQLQILPAGERIALATRIALLARPRQPCYVEGFYDELWPLVASHRGDPNFFNAVAFKGYPKPDESLFNSGVRKEHREDRLRLLASAFSLNDRLFDGTYWKRLAFSGDIDALPGLCRDRHVILIGPQYTESVGQAWGLSRYDYVAIPRTNVHRVRRKLFADVSAILARAVRASGPRPIVLTECGSLAYWLIAKLYDTEPNAFYLDIGQALNIWTMDSTEAPVFTWSQIYLALRARREGKNPRTH